jgi:predicted aspartyl protease
MGLTFVDGRVMASNGREEIVNFLVDSGAGYSLLPYQVWLSLGLEPTREESFRLADGTVVTRNLSRCYLILPHGEEYTPVILGEETDDQALLGCVTLESMGLMLNPFSRTLHPMRLLWRG